jgi:hypothetical protein
MVMAPHRTMSRCGWRRRGQAFGRSNSKESIDKGIDIVKMHAMN